MPGRIPEGARRGGVPWSVVLVEGRFTCIRPMITGFESLRELRSDPEQRANLAARPAFRAAFGRWREHAVADLVASERSARCAMQRAGGLRPSDRQRAAKGVMAARWILYYVQ